MHVKRPLVLESTAAGDVVVDAALVNVPTKGGVDRWLNQHQRDGLQFLYRLLVGSSAQPHVDAGCVLAHAPGLGKTRQVLVLVATLLLHPRLDAAGVKFVIILCPPTIAETWFAQWKEWVPYKKVLGMAGVKVECLAGGNRSKRFEKMANWVKPGATRKREVLIIGYNTYVQMKKELKTGRVQNSTKRVDAEDKKLMERILERVPDLLVCDEAHHLKNEESGCYETVKAIKARMRLLLTGTPMQNNLGEYFNMVDLACPRRLGTWEEFKESYIIPLEDAKLDETNKLAQDYSEQKLGELYKKLIDGPKAVVHYVGIEVLKEMLPPHEDIVLYVRNDDLQVDLQDYFIDRLSKRKCLADLHPLRSIWTHPHLLVEGKGAEQWEGFGELRRMANKPRPTPKLKVLAEIVAQSEERKEKLLIFSQSTECIAKIKALLDWIGVSYAVITGDTTFDARTRIINDFNNEKSTVLFLIISTNAGGEGLTLTAARRAVLFEINWNPAKDDQAAGRIYRIGQKYPTTVIRLVQQGTLEDGIYLKQNNKAAIFGRVVEGKDADTKFSREEARQLYNLERIESEYVEDGQPAIADPLISEVIDTCRQHLITCRRNGQVYSPARLVEHDLQLSDSRSVECLESDGDSVQLLDDDDFMRESDDDWEGDNPLEGVLDGITWDAGEHTNHPVYQQCNALGADWMTPHLAANLALASDIWERMMANVSEEEELGGDQVERVVMTDYVPHSITFIASIAGETGNRPDGLGWDLVLFERIMGAMEELCKWNPDLEGIANQMTGDVHSLAVYLSDLREKYKRDE